jgi:Protein of unknown function (DUF2442)
MTRRAKKSKRTGKTSTTVGARSLLPPRLRAYEPIARAMGVSVAEVVAIPDVPEEPIVINVQVGSRDFTLQLQDGRRVSVPIAWSPLLQGASKKARKNVRILGGGRALSWPDADEDLHVVDLLYPPSFARGLRA